MSGYTSRRGPGGVSQYVQHLNHIPSNDITPEDLSPFGGDDLDFLAHADFFDFDSLSGLNPNNPSNVEFNNHSPNWERPKLAGVAAVNGHGFQFGEFQTYPPTVGSSPVNNGHHGQLPPQPLSYGPQVGDKRKASVAASMPSPADLEEQSRMAAEEDKRRRNTAASARFRVKKKQREQALEKAAKDMNDKVTQLEGKVQQLEMENKWLKGLITDKNDGKTLESLQREKESEERKADDKTDGVGTREYVVGEEDEVKSEA